MPRPEGREAVTDVRAGPDETESQLEILFEYLTLPALRRLVFDCGRSPGSSKEDTISQWPVPEAMVDFLKRSGLEKSNLEIVVR